ncbi:MAG TPA: DUF1801 domain-containing protein [Clostridia bacterium]|jgi:uncharacterized protein YdhG (YjbR/CyaY superfamily)|nr:DUF1801 domain-containing protein [Clostridia bacterium]
MDKPTVAQTIDAYIEEAPAAVQPVLRELRALIREAAPAATERIAWAMPTFAGKHNLVHFAAHKAHIGLYPGADAMARFLPELTQYKTSKGAVQFPYGKPLPKELIQAIVRFCVEEDGA